jgi:hypothetical protein
MSNWLTIGASVRGLGHLQTRTPCQDAHYIKKLSKKWDIAVVSDGAGSCSNSHKGSSYTVKEFPQILSEMLAEDNWFIEGIMPSSEEWRARAFQSLTVLKQHLFEYAKTINCEYKSLSCTLIAILYSNKGAVSVHIGDGRAAVKLENGEWISVMVPFKGEQVGETVFLTSDYSFENPEMCIETQVTQSPIEAFTIISDGLERYFYQCYVIDEEGLFSDPNQSIEKIINKNVAAIQAMYDENVKKKEISKRLRNYLKSGILANEIDDKTMILGYKKCGTVDKVS